MKDLRLKAITPLALSLMLIPFGYRPKQYTFGRYFGSYPQTKFYHENYCIWKRWFESDLFGIKNDTMRKVFEVILAKSNSVKIDPVQKLYDYIERTRWPRGQEGLVFISIKSTYNAINFSTVSKTLEEAIVLAGLST